MRKSHESEPLFRAGGGLGKGGGGRGEGGFLGYKIYVKVSASVITPGSIGTTFDNG